MPNFPLLFRIVPLHRTPSSKSVIKLRRARNLTRKLLEGLALRLRDEEGGEAAHEHEEGVDFHDVVEPRALVVGRRAAGAQGSDEDLGDDGADFAGGGGEAVGGGAVAGREAWGS